MAVAPSRYQVATDLVLNSGEDQRDWERILHGNKWVNQLELPTVTQNVNCSVKLGIKRDAYDKVALNIVKGWGIPDDDPITEMLLDRKDIDVDDDTVTNFKYDDGQGGFLYGRVTTVAHVDKIDMAYAIMRLGFQLSPDMERDVEFAFSFWFKSGKKVWYENKKTTINVARNESVEDYVRARAMNTFYKQYKGRITA